MWSRSHRSSFNFLDWRTRGQLCRAWKALCYPSAADKSSGLESSSESEGREGGEQDANLTEKQLGGRGGWSNGGSENGSCEAISANFSRRALGSMGQTRYLI